MSFMIPLAEVAAEGAGASAATGAAEGAVAAEGAAATESRAMNFQQGMQQLTQTKEKTSDFVPTAVPYLTGESK